MMCMIVFLNPKILIGQETGNRSMLTGLECVPAGAITIIDFEDSKAGLPLKIVVGRQFKYEGQKTSSGQWTWGIGTNVGSTLSNKWQATFTPKNPGTKEYKGKGIIPATNLPFNNSDFGLTRGKVKVSNAMSETGDADVKVFFIKNDTNKVHSMTEPNWFYYWKKSPIIQNLLTIPGFKLYDIENCQWNPSPDTVTLNLAYLPVPKFAPGVANEYGNCEFNAINMESRDLKTSCGAPISETVIIAYEPLKTKINIGDGCGYTKEMKDGTIIDGIHVMCSTVIHEVEHAIIECEVWQNGYSNLLDSDGDGYNDDWERANSSPMFMFTVPIDKVTAPFDAYGVDKGTGAPQTYNSKLLGNKLYSVGTEYEEFRCRTKEVNSKHLFPMIDIDDWSFDPSGNFQGKQWK